MTTTEFKILELLASRKGVVFSREKILDHLWGNEKAVIDRTIDVHIRHLREKLGKAGDLIVNVRGVGYKLTA
jgi:DNA-binding response OmpR family regulator